MGSTLLLYPTVRPGGWFERIGNESLIIHGGNSKLPSDRKRPRTDIMTMNLDSAQICPWQYLLSVKCTDDKIPLYRLSPFTFKKVILIEADKETHSSKQLKTTELSLTMDNVIPLMY